MHADTTPTDGTPAEEQIAYDVPHAARVLDLSERQMWALVKSGEVESIKLRTNRRITRAALIAFIEREAARESAEPEQVTAA